MAEADLRAAEAELQQGPGPPARPSRESARRLVDEADASDLTDEPRQRHAGEHRRLLNGADPATSAERVPVRERQRDPLVGERPPSLELLARDPAERVG